MALWLKRFFNWSKTAFGIVFKKSLLLLYGSPEETEEGPRVEVRERMPTEDELTLGYAEGYNEETDTYIEQSKGIDQKDRDRHFYVVGATGSGKTRFLEHLIQQDICHGRGFGVIDPHGDLVEDVKGWLYFNLLDFRELRSRVILIEPTNPRATVSFNPLERIKNVLPETQAKELVGVFKKIWWDAWGARMEDILRNSLIALIENNLTLTELPLFLTNRLIRKRVLKNVTNKTCLERFEYFDTVRIGTWREWIESTLNKVDAFLSDRRIRQILTLPKSSFNLRDIMDNRKIILIKLEKGQLKDSADLLGSLLLSKIHMAAFSRTDIPPEQRVPFYLYIDEFQNFASESFTDILSGARKYKLALILAHQNLAQVPKELKASIMANCAIQVCFRVSRDDAQIMAKELMTPLYRQPPGWEINVQDLQELEDRRCYCLLYTSPSPRDLSTSRMPSSA